VAFWSGEAVFVYGNPELRRHSVDVVDVEVDQRVRTSVAFVLREIKPNVAASDRDEPGEARLELVLPTP
jgi:hypothetical protein